MLTMYDSVDVAAPPDSAQAVAGYLDGQWPSYAGLVRRFPAALHVSISVTSHTLGLVDDVEAGDLEPAQVPGRLQLKRGQGMDPWVYCNRSTWPAVTAAVAAAKVAQPHYWIAVPGGGPVPPPGADAVQYNTVQGPNGPYDVSSWPAPPPAVVITGGELVNLRIVGPSNQAVIMDGHLIVLPDVADAADCPFPVWPSQGNLSQQFYDEIVKAYGGATG